jgi:ribulose-phosphate 3-epimerase
MQLIPVILEKDFRELLSKIKKIENLTELVQIDILDNSLIKNTTFNDIDKLGDIPTKTKFEVHLMVDEPLIYAKGKVKNIASMCMQIEARNNHIEEFINTCRENGYKVGLSILWDTPAERIEPYLDRIDFVQFMTIKAGFQGNPFIHQVIDKIREFHKKHPKVVIQTDGGANELNIPELVSAGVTNIVIGSALFKSAMPSNAFMKFKALAQQSASKKEGLKPSMSKVTKTKTGDSLVSLANITTSSNDEKSSDQATVNQYELRPSPRKIAFLGGAGWSENDEPYKDAFEVAKILAENGYEIVNGGGPGVMRASTDGAHAGGGKALAITYHPNKAKKHYEGVDKLNAFDEEILTLDYFDRTKVMLQNTDVHIVFKGSIGTLSEFGMTWISSWIHEPNDKPIILYGEFWKGILDAIEEGMLIEKGERRMLEILTTPKQVLGFIRGL